MKAPIAPQKKKIFRTHGDYRVDEYFWLRDKKNPEVKKYLSAENRHTKKWFSDTKDFQEKLFKELKGRIREKDSSVPYFYNNYWRGTEYKKGMEYPIYWRSKSKTGKKEILLNMDEMAKGHKYFNIGGSTISHNNTMLAYAQDIKADKNYDLFLKDLNKEEVFCFEKHAESHLVWSKDDRYLFYVKSDETQRPYQIYKYEVSTKKKELIFEETDPGLYASMSLSTSHDYLIINSDGHEGNKQYIYDWEVEGIPGLVMPLKKNVEYFIDHAEDGFFMVNDRENPDGQMYWAESPEKTIKKWKIIYKPKKGARIRNFSLHKDFMLIGEVSKANQEVLVIPKKGKKYYIDLPESAYSITIGVNKEYDSKTARINYESFTTPDQVIEHNLKTKKNTVLKTYTPLGGYKSDQYHSERLWAIATDGTKIPISLVYRKDLFKNDGSNPLLLYGYGSYGHAINPFFSTNNLSLLNRGFVFAVAHIRGGSELGQDWYLSAKFLKKKKTFTDFIDCAEYLVNKKYTSPEKLCIRGGSAGGMLMGAVVNMRPDLFCAVISQVPFVDVINTMMDETIPLTVGEFVEWGNPKNKTYYNYMKSYSPYDNIEEKNYPAMYISAGFNDTQVHYWEPAKYVARLRVKKTGDNPLLLDMDMNTGHGGNSGRFAYLHDIVKWQIFLFKVLGIEK